MATTMISLARTRGPFVGGIVLRWSTPKLRLSDGPALMFLRSGRCSTGDTLGLNDLECLDRNGEAFRTTQDLSRAAFTLTVMGCHQRIRGAFAEREFWDAAGAKA
jgi:hypothetical protein